MEINHWVIVLTAVCGFWIILAIFLACFCGPHQFTCHLCEVKIPRRLWESGEHRMPCAQDHERFLYELPDATQKSAKCPTCGDTLKVTLILTVHVRKFTMILNKFLSMLTICRCILFEYRFGRKDLDLPHSNVIKAETAKQVCSESLE